MLSPSVAKTATKSQNWATFGPVPRSSKNWDAVFCVLEWRGQCNFNGLMGNWAISDPATRSLRRLCHDLGVILGNTAFAPKPNLLCIMNEAFCIVQRIDEYHSSTD